MMATKPKCGEGDTVAVSKTEIIDRAAEMLLERDCGLLAQLAESVHGRLQLVTVSQAAQLMSISKRQVRSLGLPIVSIGAWHRYRLRDVEELIARRTSK